ncbi:uncharacterized protein IUM83_15793 [Phytophthora cinnamomi]|uniref:uncharacterized protein n=1 Tax=Phytophthora cinnamomi TaxID=4785 RepID=UPI003559D74E|nr:hypothetical protein IUM83_15793 [Phytophthora cinnamomi]
MAVNEKDASASLVAQSTNAQRGFLRAVMNDNVRFGEFLGVELLLDQWERYSLYHAAIQWTMKSLSIVQLTEPRVVDEANQHDDGPLVVSITADLRVRFSRRTIEEVFPHLVGDEALTQSLIGLEVTYPCVNHFHFDKDGKIEWYAPEADFVGALMSVLRDPVLVARVMGDALIAKGHMIGDETDGRQLAVARVEGDFVSAPSSVASLSPTLNEDALVAEPTRSWQSKEPEVAIVSDDEPSPESPPCQTSRLRVAYILDE